MTARKNTSPDEIKRRLIADAENPDAWEPLGAVAPSPSPRPAWYGQSVGPSRGGEPPRTPDIEPRNQNPQDTEEDDIPEVDFRDGVRGKYFERYQQGTNVVLLEPDMAKVFQGSDVVNQALREYLSEHGQPPKVTKAD
jgi:hypothetical protein